MSETPSDSSEVKVVVEGGKNEGPGIRADIPQEAIDAAMRSVEQPGEKPSAAASSDPSAERIRHLENMLNELTARGAQTQERLKETHERYLRTAADFENWKKRAAKEREEVVKFGNERLLKDIIPVLDNLERALQAGGDSATLLDGVRMVLKQFTDVLSRFGVRLFASVGETFDPSRHEALMQAESDAPVNTVISEMAKGYMLNDRLVRPAAVVVSKGRPSAAPLPDGPAAEPQPPGDGATA